MCSTLVPNCDSKRQTGCGAQIVAKRPVSPHVFEIDGKGMHYKFPINATTSIMNRVTGTALTIGETCLCVGSTYPGFQAPEERQTRHAVTGSLTAGLVLQIIRVPLHCHIQVCRLMYPTGVVQQILALLCLFPFQSVRESRWAGLYTSCAGTWCVGAPGLSE